MTNQEKNIRHLYSRAGFGAGFSEMENATGKSIENVVEKFFKDAKKISPLRVVENESVGYIREMIRKRRSGDKEIKKPDDEQVREFIKKSKEQLGSVNAQWILQMSHATAPLREKMTLFWHDHFACRERNAFYTQELNNIHRKYALGNFRDLLMEVSKSPAMLKFLNNQQNRKEHPNENFARELMELFTLGRGHYSEQDVKEAARAFTGWAFNPLTGEFDYRMKNHDDGMKTFLGRRGKFTGDDVIDIILEEKQTAYFLSEKLYRFFVNYNIDPVSVNELSDILYQSNYDIGLTMKRMFTSSWFYNDDNIGTMIKSPVEFIVGLNRTFGLEYEEPLALVLIQRALGQILFFPPNVSGWAGGRSWIDSNTLMTRLRIPSALLNGGQIELSGNPDPEEEAIFAMNERFKEQLHQIFKVSMDWDKFLAGVPENITRDKMIDLFLALGLSEERRSLLLPPEDHNIKDTVVQLVSLPEYQMA